MAQERLEASRENAKPVDEVDGAYLMTSLLPQTKPSRALALHFELRATKRSLTVAQDSASAAERALQTSEPSSAPYPLGLIVRLGPRGMRELAGEHEKALAASRSRILGGFCCALVVMCC